MKQPQFQTWLAGMMEKTDLEHATAKLAANSPPKGTVLCTIEDEGLRRLLAVAFDISATSVKAVKESQEQHENGIDPASAAFKDFLAEHNWFMQQADVVGTMFWHAVQHEYPQLRGKDSLMLGPDWQIFENVEQERRRSEGISIITISSGLADIFGGRPNL